MRAALVALASLAAVGPASAASIGIVSFDGPNPIISLAGPITPNDDHKFDEFVQALRTPAVVRLSSPGGNAMAALAIGRAIARAGYSTYVAEGDLCASACGLIWLAGKQRYSGPTSHIGLHASYLTQDGRNIETSAGNALVGKYLGELGYQDDFVVYATSAPPDGMFWLNRSVTDHFNVAWEMRGQDMATLNTLDLPQQPPTPVAPGPPVPQPNAPKVAEAPPGHDGESHGTDAPAPDFMPAMPGYPRDQRPASRPKPLPRAKAVVPPRTLADDVTEFFFGAPPAAQRPIARRTSGAAPVE